MSVDQLSFIDSQDETLRRYDPELVNLIFNLLEDATSISVVSEFLKEKNFHHSAGSWKDLKDKRIVPLLNAGDLSIADLKKLLASVEEFPACHCYLYQCSREASRALMLTERIRGIAHTEGIPSVLESPLVLNMPDQPQITDIRWDEETRGKCLVIKVIETCEKRGRSEEIIRDGYLIKKWPISQKRAVNVIRLFESGLLEFRIHSYREGDQICYSKMQRIWSGVLSPFLPRNDFNPKSIATAKEQLWEHRDERSGEMRFQESTFVNNYGNTVQGSAARGDISSDPSVEDCLDRFSQSGARCDSSNLYWLENEDGLPSKNIHTLLSGRLNEFAITSSCTKSDYEYVFDKITSLA